MLAAWAASVERRPSWEQDRPTGSKNWRRAKPRWEANFSAAIARGLLPDSHEAQSEQEFRTASGSLLPARTSARSSSRRSSSPESKTSRWLSLEIVEITPLASAEAIQSSHLRSCNEVHQSADLVRTRPPSCTAWPSTNFGSNHVR
jgi:hypothetical protein